MDHRDMAARLPKRMRAEGNSVVFELDEEEYRLPLKYDVCPTCDGKGSHVNPSIDAHGITSEEFYEDPDFGESYFRGDYDVPCYECGGLRVIPGVDDNHLSPEQEKIYERLIDQLHEDMQFAREVEAERRYGC